LRLGVFGGTFNPIHYGHLRVAEEVREVMNLDRVIFMPSGTPPLKHEDVIGPSHRYAMTELATEGNDSFSVSDHELQRPEKSFTVSTLETYRERHPAGEMLFILGLDAFLDLPNWWMPERLTGLADFVVVTRPGFHLRDLHRSPYIDQPPAEAAGGWFPEGAGEPAEQEGLSGHAGPGLRRVLRFRSGRRVFPIAVTPLDISSTAIRALLRERKSVRYLLPDAVVRYIAAHALYAQG